MSYDIHDKAKKKVRSIKRLYIHMSLFAVMGLFFFLLNVAADPFDIWWFYPLLPWGVLVAMHHVMVKGIPGTGILSAEWEEREFEKQYDRLSEEENLSFLNEPMEDNYLPYRELSEEELALLRERL